MSWRLASVVSVSVLCEKQPGFYLITAMGSATRRSLKSWRVRAAATLARTVRKFLLCARLCKSRRNDSRWSRI
jgi:hypothetical protein